jgi:hypothetical protein
MPIVKGKRYPYTAKGKKAAATARKKKNVKAKRLCDNQAKADPRNE